MHLRKKKIQLMFLYDQELFYYMYEYHFRGLIGGEKKECTSTYLKNK